MSFSSKAGTGNPGQKSSFRYLILLMIFIITTFNYADRATLSVTGSAMKSEFGLDAISIGYVFSAFSWSYVIFQLPAGWLLDRFGARRVYAFSIFFWSLFTLLQSAVGWLGSSAAAIIGLFLLRFVMGMAEAPAFPANAKVVASWFPTRERGTASAIFNSAQYFAAVLFTPLMAWITHRFGWHYVYLVMGSTGLVLALAWLKLFKNPADHPSISATELAHITDGGGLVNGRQTSTAQAAPVGGWKVIRQLLGNRMLLGVYLAQYCINVLTYFFLTWFPIYLVQARGMTILQAGLIASLPAICGFLGGVSGGMISDAIIRRGHSLTMARKLPIVAGMLLSSCIVICNYVNSDWLIVALMSLAFFGKGLGALGWAVVSDTSPREAIGLSGSIFNMFGNLAGIVTPIVIGYLVAKTGSFDAALGFVCVHAVITILCYLVIVKQIKRVELNLSSPTQ